MRREKPTVLNVSQNYYIRGGSDRIFFATTDLLKRRGHHVIPFAAADSRNQRTKWAPYFPAAADFERPGPLDLLRFIYSLPACRAIRALINDHKPDIAHLHIYYGKLTGSILPPLKKAGIPIVQTLHEYKLICPVYSLVSNGHICEACRGHHFWRAIPQRCNRHSLARTMLSVTESYMSRMLGSVNAIDHFIAVSDFVRTKMLANKIPAEKISTIHNYIDASKIKPGRRRGSYFLYFGRLERLKGIFALVEAAASLTQIPLLIVGDGNARSELAQIIERRNLEHVKLLGFKRGKDLEQLVQDSICTILPSEWYEPFPTTILESFAHARPVIASGIGGITEMITHGVDGLLVEAGNIEALREEMAWLAGNPRRAVDMGMSGRKKVETSFGPQAHYEKLLRVYQSVL